LRVIYGFREEGDAVLGLREDGGEDGVNMATLPCVRFSCSCLALSDISAIIPMATNTEKIKAIIDGITIMNQVPEFILQKQVIYYS
jgi:hypothetical protein